MILISNLNNKIATASFWSMLSEIAAKAISPIVLVVMARLLTPSDYGVMTIATIILSFVQIISDLGMSKSIIQNNSNTKYVNQVYNVSFWTNLFLGVLIFILVFLSSDLLATLFKEPKSSLVIKVISFQIILFSLVSVHNAIFQRELDFKKIFCIRLITVVAPALVSIPFAFLGFGYWALVAGSMVGALSNTIVFWFISKWRPQFNYDFEVLKSIIRFSLWNTVENLLGWLVGWVDLIILGAFLNTYSLGLYRTATNFILAIFTLFLSPILPVLFSTLSRVQEDELNFKEIFMKAQKILAIISFPIGMGLFLFSNVISELIFGSKWNGIAWIIGVLGLMNGLISVVRINGEAFRAKGMANINTYIMILNTFFYVITYLISIQFGLEIYVGARSIIAFVPLFYHYYFSKKIFNVSWKESIKNIMWPLIGIVCMIVAEVIMSFVLPNAFVFSVIEMIICIIIYCGILLQDKNNIIGFLKYLPINVLPSKWRSL